MIFWKKKEAPTVELGGLVFKFDSSDQLWETDYNGVLVSVEGTSLKLPIESIINGMLKIIAFHEAHIDKMIDEMMWEEMSRGSARLACLNISSASEFSVSYLGDETWGDLGYDLWFKDGKITNEGAAD